jgi:hypothetical protein
VEEVPPLNRRPLGRLASWKVGWVEKVWGDFSKPGEPFVFRIHQDAGYMTLPHVHPIDENITVVKGTCSLGIWAGGSIDPRWNKWRLGLWDGTQEYGALRMVEDRDNSAGARNLTVFVHGGRASLRAY